VTRSVVLVSGGLDSAVVLAMAIEAGHEVFPFHVQYGQKNARELLSAKALVAFFSLYDRLRVVTVDMQIRGSALTDEAVEVPSAQADGVPATYVPARNTFMLGLAASFAESVSASRIWVGFNQLEDVYTPAGRASGVRFANRVSSVGYPDCSDEFVDAMNDLLKLGMRRPAKVVAPIIDMTKSEIIREALWLQVPIALTWSCYAGGAAPCGRCDACRARVAAFASLCKPDPAQLT